VTSIEGVFFDFGGVVVDAPFERFAELERSAHLPVNLLRRVNARNPDTNAWARLERGAIEIDEFVRLFEAEAKKLGATVDARAVLQLVLNVPATREHARVPVMDAVQRCRDGGLRVGLLTNNMVAMDTSPYTAWVYEEFDVVVESCRVGLRKPDSALYPLACARLGTSPERTVLLDDLGINLKSARQAGLHTIKVIDPVEALAGLDRVIRSHLPADRLASMDGPR
jgi:putative hydrolase of the HAD superfamily